MKTKYLIAWLVCLLWGAQAVVAAPDTITLKTTADTYVSYATTPAERDLAFGSDSILKVYNNNTTTSQRRQAYLRFNISGLTNVTDIRVRLYTPEVSGGTARQLKLFPVTANLWPESTLTWNNMFTADGTGAELPSDTLAVVSFTSVPAGWVDFSDARLTSRVKAAIANGDSIISFRLRESTGSTTAGGNAAAIFYSKEHQSGLAPQMLAVSTSAGVTSITVGGVAIDGFNVAKEHYKVILPLGTTLVPQVGVAVTGGTEAIAQATNLTGTEEERTATITLSPTAGGANIVYTIEFEIETLAASWIKIDGQALEGFDPAQFLYEVKLPVGTKTIPTVTAEATAALAGTPNVQVTQATALTGADATRSAKVVIALSGAEQVYTIVFSVAATTTTTTLTAVDDTYTYPGGGTGTGNLPDEVYGTLDVLHTFQNASPAIPRQTYLKFNIASLNGSVENATLRLFAETIPPTTATATMLERTIQVTLVELSTWSETTLSISGVRNGDVGKLIDEGLCEKVLPTTIRNEWIELTGPALSKAVKDAKESGQTYISLRVRETAAGSGNVVAVFHSKENASGNAPQLAVALSAGGGETAVKVVKEDFARMFVADKQLYIQELDDVAQCDIVAIGTGALCQTATVNNGAVVSLQHLPAGTYMATLRQYNRLQVLKFVVR